MADATDFSAALRYGPRTQQALNRSQYLADALKALAADSGKIQSGSELGARLLAAALLRYGDSKAKSKLNEAVRADQGDEASRLLAGLQTTPDAPSMLSPPSIPAAPESQPAMPARPPGGLPSAAEVPPMPSLSGGSGAAPSGGLGAMAQALKGLLGNVRITSGYRTPEHNAEVGGVKNSYHTRGAGEALDFQAPGVTLPGLAKALANAGLPRKELLDEGDHFHWAWGGGAGSQPGALMPANAPGQPQPLQAPGPMPGAPQPAGAPSVAPAATPAAPPQAAAGVTYNLPTPEEIARARMLMSDPRTFDQGRAYALKLQERMVTPQKWDTTTANGRPVQADPYTGRVRVPELPDELKTSVLAAQAAGIPTAPQGLYVQRDPMGNLKEAPGGPPTGYNATPQGYAPVQGGPADPYRVQAPPPGYAYQGGRMVAIQGGPDDPTRPQTPQAGYQWQGPGSQAPIPGSGADPRNPTAILQGTQVLREELKPLIASALSLKRNVDAVRTGFAQANGPGDIAMVNGLQRLIDDGVVREGDVALQLKAQGIAGGLAGLSGYLNSKGFFDDPAVRRKILTTANSLYAQVNENYRAQVFGRKAIADSAFGPGTFESFVFTPDQASSLGWTPQGKPPSPGDGSATPPPPPGAAGSRAELLREAIRRHLPMTAAQVKEARDLGLIK